MSALPLLIGAKVNERRRIFSQASYWISPVTTGSIFDLASRSIPSVFTRASTATFFNKSGILATAAINEPVIEYDPATGACLGLRIWDAITNQVLESEQIDSGYWGPVVGTVSGNTATAPNGAVTADKLIIANGGPSGSVSIPATISSGATVTGSIFFKAAGAERFEIVLLSSNNTTPYGRVTFNTSTGAITIPAAVFNGGTNVSAGASFVGNGWYRGWLTVTYPATTAAGLRFTITRADLSNGDGIAGVFLFGAQFNTGALAPYVPTSGTTVSTAADVMSIAGSDFTRIWNQSMGTIYVNAQILDTSANKFVFDASNGTFQNEIGMFEASVFSSVTNTNNVSQGASFGGSITNNSLIKHAFAFAANDLQGYGNGVQLATVTNATIPPVDRMYIGSRVGGSFWLNAYVLELAIFRSRRNNRDLILLTQ